MESLSGAPNKEKKKKTKKHNLYKLYKVMASPLAQQHPRFKAVHIGRLHYKQDKIVISPSNRTLKMQQSHEKGKRKVTFIWAVSGEKVPRGLSCCHTKRRMGALRYDTNFSKPKKKTNKIISDRAFFSLLGEDHFAEFL